MIFDGNPNWFEMLSNLRILIIPIRNILLEWRGYLCRNCIVCWLLILRCSLGNVLCSPVDWPWIRFEDWWPHLYFLLTSLLYNYKCVLISLGARSKKTRMKGNVISHLLLLTRLWNSVMAMLMFYVLLCRKFLELGDRFVAVEIKGGNVFK